MSGNLIYYAPGTATTFKDTGDGTGNTVNFDTKNISSGAGRMSSVWDRSTGSQPRRFNLKGRVETTSAATISTYMEVWIQSSQVNEFDFTNVGITARTQFQNMTYLGIIGASSNIDGPFSYDWDVEISGRYVILGFWNLFGVATVNTDDLTTFIATPTPNEVQIYA